MTSDINYTNLWTIRENSHSSNSFFVRDLALFDSFITNQNKSGIPLIIGTSLNQANEPPAISLIKWPIYKVTMENDQFRITPSDTLVDEYYNTLPEVWKENHVSEIPSAFEYSKTGGETIVLGSDELADLSAGESSLTAFSAGSTSLSVEDSVLLGVSDNSYILIDSAVSYTHLTLPTKA